MIEVKTAELIGPALDWAVAKADSTKIDDSRGKELRIDVGAGFQSPWMPSVNWHQGGPMIQYHQIDLEWDGCDGIAFWWIAMHQDVALKQVGDTPLIAVCRAIVAAELGDTVSVPRELMQ